VAVNDSVANVIGYVPAGEVLVAVVVSVAVPETTVEVSLFTKPVIVSLKLGTACPKTMPALIAVTVSVAGLTVKLCETAVAAP